MDQLPNQFVYPGYIIRRECAFGYTPAEALSLHNLPRRDRKKAFRYQMWKLAWQAVRKEFHKPEWSKIRYPIGDYSASHLALKSWSMRGSK